MKEKSAPLFVPAVALATGAWLAFQLSSLSLPALVLLFALGLAWGRRLGPAVAGVAAGMLVAAVTHGLPQRAERAIDPDRPVEARVRVSGHWLHDAPPPQPEEPAARRPRRDVRSNAGDSGWFAPARLIALSQAGRQSAPPIEIGLRIPGDEPPPPIGSTLAVAGYLHRSAGFANREPAPAGPWRLRLKSRLLMRQEAGPGALTRLSARLRERVEAAYAGIASRSPGEHPGAALARALVLGDPGALPLAWRRGLAAAGLLHLLSVAGLHLALVGALAFGLGGLLPRPLRRLQPAFAALAIGGYLLLVGPHLALLRATVLAVLALAALVLERPPAALNALACAVGLLVLAQPEVVERPAFDLSVAASAGVLLLAPHFARRWRRLPLRLGSALAVSLGATLPALPFALPLFHHLPVLTPFVDLLAVPWTALSLLASLAWTALAVGYPGLAAATLPLLDTLAAPFGWPAALGPHYWPTFPILASFPLAAALALGLGLLLWGGRWRAVTGVTLVAISLWGLSAPLRVRHGAELILFDVGQGDSILLRDGGRAILIDGGGWEGADFGGRVLLPALLAEGVRHLDAVVMTHPDRDHCGGLADLAAHLPVDEFWTGPGWSPTGCAGELFTLPGVRTRLLATGDRLALGRWRLAVLHAGEGERTNERSLILRAEVHGRRALLTGDAGRPAEAAILERFAASEVAADLLKIGHHGSNGSTGEDLLDAVRPRLALVSVGVANPYHHPSPAVLARLAGRGRPVLRSDRSGEVVVRFAPGGHWRLELPGEPRQGAVGR